MNAPKCCKDDAKDMVAAGKKPGAALAAALKNHKAGKHDDDNGSGDADNDGD